ncbi:MAG: hypothetical protein H7Z41_03565 [Cytophagales bacterium]|nr:hypothetical protein [Armatimonadota bacterium]
MIRSVVRFPLGSLSATLASLSALVAQAQPPLSVTDTSAPPPVTATVAPSEVREVVATGTAAIGTGGVLAARRAAEAQALRNAVEKTTGVFVSARTLTQNYVLVRDQVTTRAEGFATLKERLNESVGPESVTVRVRALVSLRPLAERLKGLGLTRAWRVHVTGAGNLGGTPGAHILAATASLEATLTEAGFVVVSDKKEADIEVLTTPQIVTTHTLPLVTAAGPMTMYTVRGQITTRATRAPTGEVVSALATADTDTNISLVTARSNATAAATRTLAPRLAEALMLLPARDSQPVQLVVSGVGSAARAGRLEDALNLLAGVRGVTRRSLKGGEAVWELDVLTDALPLLSRRLEEDAALRPFRLLVASDGGARIVAAARGSRPSGR